MNLEGGGTLLNEFCSFENCLDNVYYSYAYNLVVIAYRHLFANLFLSFEKTYKIEKNSQRFNTKKHNLIGGEILFVHTYKL